MTEQLEKALYVVATPIGNLGDITHRALHILKEVDIIAAEDTRNSKSLLSHFGLSGRLIAVHEHNEYHAADGIIKLLSEGKSVALVTDAGTPAISDPGSHLVEKVMAAGHRIIPIPGPSALIAAISASGLGEQGFLFHGFLPAKSKDRKNVLTSLRNAALPYVLVFYESPHRIAETVADLCEVFESTSELVICRELTKKFETIQRLPLLQ
ncbi:MAG: 16S rRNA (cytidine(1402)-2'-O)-methyltransferase, partial [Betaproteobacteria bacterium]|nr:16S rRNA (cytidine(1402)-2'-O)-methyltransferase [Betaproteobacteria bacterium]